MDPLTAFSLAASIIQVAEFGIATVHKCYQAYKEGTSNQGIEESASEFLSVSRSLQGSLAQAASEKTKDDDDLFAVATRSVKAASTLQTELKKYGVDPNTSKGRKIFNSIRSTMKQIYRSSKIKDMEQELESCRSAVNTSILVNFRKKYRDMNIEMINGFESLSKTAQDMVAEFSRQNAEIQKAIKREHEITRDTINSKTRFHRILDSLSFPEMKKRQESVKDAHERTFEWVFENEGVGYGGWSNFSRWLEEGSNTYWISGKPGSGKSTLMRFIVSHPTTRRCLQLWASQNCENLVTAACFIYCGKDAGTLQYSIAGVLRSLLYQLLEQLGEAACEQCLQDVNDKLEWQERNLKLVIRRLIEHFPTTKFCFFFDGQDELANGANDRIEDYLEFQASILQGSNLNVKCCVSSRSWPLFQDTYKTSPQLRLQDLTKRDITTFVNDKLNTTEMTARRLDLDAVSLRRIIEGLVNKAEGVFLWATVAVTSIRDGIRNGDSILDLNHIVKELPEELEELYGYMFSKIRKKDQCNAALYFLLTWEMDTDLSTLTLAILEADPQIADQPITNLSWNSQSFIDRCQSIERKILTCSGGMLEIEVNYETKTILPLARRNAQPALHHEGHIPRFIHRTAEDYISKHSRLLVEYAKPILPTPASLHVMILRLMLFKMQHFPWEALVPSIIYWWFMVGRAAKHLVAARHELKSEIPRLRSQFEDICSQDPSDEPPRPVLSVDPIQYMRDNLVEWPLSAVDFEGYLVSLQASLPPDALAKLDTFNATYYLRCTLETLPHRSALNRRGNELDRQGRILKFMESMIDAKADVNAIDKGLVNDKGWDSSSGSSCWQYLLRNISRIQDSRYDILKPGSDLYDLIKAALKAGAQPNCEISDSVWNRVVCFFLDPPRLQRMWERLGFDQKERKSRCYRKATVVMHFSMSPAAIVRFISGSDCSISGRNLSSDLYKMMLGYGCVASAKTTRIAVTQGLHEACPIYQSAETDIGSRSIRSWILPLDTQEKISSIMGDWLSDVTQPLYTSLPLSNTEVPYAVKIAEIVSELVDDFLGMKNNNES